MTETGAATVAIAPEEGWGLEPSASVGPPFAVPEPVLLAARHLSRHSLDARGAFLRVVEGLPRHYVLVEGCLLDGPGEQGAEDLELALVRLARAAGGDRPAEVVKLVSGPLAADYPGAELFWWRGGRKQRRAATSPRTGRVIPTGPVWPYGWPTLWTWPRRWRGRRQSSLAPGP